MGARNLPESTGSGESRPVARFYTEMLATYPEAKFILSHRDPERWYDSTARTIYRVRDVLAAPSGACCSERDPWVLLVLAVGALGALAAVVGSIL